MSIIMIISGRMIIRYLDNRALNFSKATFIKLLKIKIKTAIAMNTGTSPSIKTISEQKKSSTF